MPSARGDSDLLTVEGHHVADHQLPSPPGFVLSVHRHPTVGQYALGVTTDVDQAGQLEELAQTDGAIGDRLVAHRPI